MAHIIIHIARICRCLFPSITALAIYLHPVILAAEAPIQAGSNEFSATKLLLTTILSFVLIIVLGLFLIYFIRYLSTIRGASVSGIKASAVKSILSDKIKDPILAEEVEALFEQELDRRVSDVSGKYERILQEKDVAIQEVDKKFKKTLTEKKQTESVVRSIAEGLVVLNSKGEVMMMNPAAEKLLDVSKEKQIGKHIPENLKKEQLISLAKERAGAGEKVIEVNAQNEETKKVLRSSTAVIEDENGQTIGMVSVLSDITKQKELDRMKDNFVSSVTHELRTPIVAIRNSVALLLEKSAGPLNDNQEKFLRIADRNLHRLNLLINDLLDISKLEAGKMDLHPIMSSLGKVVAETCETLNSWASAKDIALRKKVQDGLPDTYFDPNRITQVLTNLIGNAIKFTPKQGFISTEVYVDKDKESIHVAVSDNGIGISKEDQAKLFNKFQQVGSGERASTDIGGTGLGLAICKELIELHNGVIWVESDAGKGAKFLFKLPIKQEASPSVQTGGKND